MQWELSWKAHENWPTNVYAKEFEPKLSDGITRADVDKNESQRHTPYAHLKSKQAEPLIPLPLPAHRRESQQRPGLWPLPKPPSSFDCTQPKHQDAVLKWQIYHGELHTGVHLTFKQRLHAHLQPTWLSLSPQSCRGVKLFSQTEQISEPMRIEIYAQI